MEWSLAIVALASLLGPALGDLSWELALYAVLSLTLVHRRALGLRPRPQRGPARRPLRPLADRYATGTRSSRATRPPMESTPTELTRPRGPAARTPEAAP